MATCVKVETRNLVEGSILTYNHQLDPLDPLSTVGGRGEEWGRRQGKRCASPREGLRSSHERNTNLAIAGLRAPKLLLGGDRPQPASRGG